MRPLLATLAFLLAAPPLAAGELGAADPRAAEIAAAVMERMGGEEAWRATRYLTWSFFDRRRHLWDKHSGDIRVEGRDRDSQEPYLILMNLHSKQGRAWKDGQEVTDPETLAELLDLGEAAWINDSYWMFMPYKLRDPGVTLASLGEATMLDGRPAEVLELTFSDVGRTPENKYRVYVAADSGLVEQWDFYGTAEDAEPRFQVPWRDWQRHGRILLSADRGERAHTGVAVLDEVPAELLTSPEPVDWEALVASAGGEPGE
jgi:hypothetical protein